MQFKLGKCFEWAKVVGAFAFFETWKV